MRFIRVQITDSLHTRLKALSTHHGEFTHLIRRAIREYVTKEEHLHAQTREVPERTDTKVES